MYRLLILIIFSLSCNVNAKDLRFLNPEIFGKSINENINLLLPGNEDDIIPYIITTDVQQEKKIYFAATIRYLTNMTIEEAKESINRHYKKYEIKESEKDADMGMWRNEDEGFSMQLSKAQVEPAEIGIQIIYISF